MSEHVEVKRVESSASPAIPAAPKPPRWSGFIKHFLEGMKTPFDGWRFMLKHWQLWRFAWAAVIINFFTTILALILAAWGGWWLITYIHSHPKFAGFWMTILEVFLIIGIIVSVLTWAVIVYFVLGSALTGYFNSILAKHVELILGTPESELKDPPFKYQVIDGIHDAAVITATNLFCLAIGCVPFVGPAISFYVTCFVFGYDYLDLPMALRGMRRKDKRAFARQHRAHTLGLGLTVFAFNFIPILGGVILASAAAGAVLLRRKLTGETPSGAVVIDKHSM